MSDMWRRIQCNGCQKDIFVSCEAINIAEGPCRRVSGHKREFAKK